MTVMDETRKKHALLDQLQTALNGVSYMERSKTEFFNLGYHCGVANEPLLPLEEACKSLVEFIP